MIYDYIVIGARCAGAALANFLGQYGYTVLLIDKYAKPGPTISTHIIGETDVYDRLNIRDQIESAGAPAITRMRVDLEGSVFESDLVVTNRVLGLRREILDQLLLDAALNHPNVQARLSQRFESIVYENGKIKGVRCLDKDGNVVYYAGRVVIGADGRSSLVAKEVKAQHYLKTQEHHHAVYYAYLTGVVPFCIPTLEWYWADRNVILCNPIDKGMYCLAVMVPQEELSVWKKNPTEAYWNVLRKIKNLAPRLEHAEIFGKIRGITNLQSYVKSSYGEGWALVGDAGAHLHPVTGVGIDNAICTAEYLAIQLHEYQQTRKSWKEAMEEYERQRDERIVPQYEASLRTLSYTDVPLLAEVKQNLGMLCTFPSLIKRLAVHSNDVLQLLTSSKLTKEDIKHD